MYHPRRHRDLSSLAKGSGFYRNGVEVECYADDFKAYSLTGQPILKSSAVGTGKHSKSYKSHRLNLPKTYVTRRGKMVLFTAPEDMILGNTCVLHQKPGDIDAMVTDEDLLSNHHDQRYHDNHHYHKYAEGIPTTTALYNDPHDPLMITSYRQNDMLDPGGNKWAETRIEGGAWQDERRVKAGHFTDVYLRSLQKSASQVSSEDCMIEDIEGSQDETAAGQKVPLEDSHMDLDTPLIPNCDSGLGHSLGPSSGRLSALSHQSELPSPHVIPHGREPLPLSEDEGKPPSCLPVTEDEPASNKMEDDGGLEALKRELNLYKVPPSKPKPPKKSASKVRKKKRSHGRPSDDGGGGGGVGDDDGASVESSKSKTRKSSSNRPKNALNGESRSSMSSSDAQNKPGGGHLKPATKSKKRRDRKTAVPVITLAKEKDSNEHKGGGKKEEDGERLRMVGSGQYMSDVSSVSVSLTDDGSEANSRERRASRAEERRLDIERKRAEKRELERQRKLEEEERERLKEELANSQIQLQGGGTESIEEVDNSDDESLLDPLSPHSSSHDISQQPTLESLQQARLRESRHTLIALRGEEIAKKLSCEIESALDAIAYARQVAEEVEMKKEMEERQRRKEEEAKRRMEEARRRQEEEDRDALAKRFQDIDSNTTRLKKECENELNSERRYHKNPITQTIMFSYFSYVPPARKKPSKVPPPKRGGNKPQLQQ